MANTISVETNEMEKRKPRLVSIARGDKAEIFRSINKEAVAEGYEVLRAVNKTTPEDGDFFELYQGKVDDLWNRFTTKVSGADGFKNKKGTKKLIKVLESYQPDLIVVHFAHSHFLNFPLVVNYAKSHKIPLVFVANDCWVFTGKCPYFLGVNCLKWKTACSHCPDKRNFPPALIFDGTKRLFKEKENLLSSFEGLTIVAPTKWTLGLLKESFLKDRDTRLIYNGTNLSLFYPVDPSPLRKKLGLAESCHVLLSVARPWSARKGLSYINYIASKLDPNQYRCVVVGVGKNDVTHPSIIRIEERLSYEDFRQVYSMADVFVNPTMVNSRLQRMT